MGDQNKTPEPGHFIAGPEICKCDQDASIVYAGEGFTRLVGYTRGQLAADLGNCHNSLVLQGDLRAMQDGIALQCAEKQGCYAVAYRVRHRDGHTLWVLDNGKEEITEDGEKLLYRMLTDITALKKTEEKLRASNRRYEIAMEFSDITIFDYDIRTGRMEHHLRDVAEYQTPRVMDDAVETMIKMGVIQPESVAAYRALYRRIEEGAPTAGAVIRARDARGRENVLELNLTVVYDGSDENPTHAIGVKKDITKAMLLKRERNYGSTLTANRVLTYEANVTKNKILHYNEAWAHELKITDFDSFSAMTACAAENSVVQEDRELFLRSASPELIAAAYEQGERMLQLEYRRQVKDSPICWYERALNIVRDEITGDLIVRSYIVNIDDRKKKAERVQNEHLHYEAMLSRSATVYEVDLTGNRFLAGHENREALYGVEVKENYDEMIRELAEKMVCRTDRGAFLEMLLRKNALDAFASGVTERSCEYRRRDAQGAFAWVRCTLHLFEEPCTDTIKGFAYVEKIDEQKRKELALIYRAQHDMLTGFYNKLPVAEHINEFLADDIGRAGHHAFFMIDLDYFKRINDHFGHAFGDTVLAQFAVKLRALFRDDDIIGRIGGDEFVVLMKNVPNKKCTLVKAKEICKTMVEKYTRDGIDYRLSVSVGIACYCEHGENYETLYCNSDTALYYSKEHGRNGFSIYRKNMLSGGANDREPERGQEQD